MDVSPAATQIPGEQKVSTQYSQINFQTEFLVLADILAGIGLIYITRLLFARFAPIFVGYADTDGGDAAHELFLFTIIAALMLRAPPLLRPRHVPVATMIHMIAWRACIALGGLLVVAVATHGADPASARRPAVWLALLACWIVLSLVTFVFYLRHLLVGGAVREAVAVVGTRAAARRLVPLIAADADVVAVIDRLVSDNNADLLDDDPCGDGFAEVAELARSGEIDTVIVALDQEERVELGPLVNRLKALPVPIAICPDLEILQSGYAELSKMLGLPTTIVADRPIKRLGRMIKEFIDRFGAALMLLLLLPLMAAIALAIAIDSPGPVIYRQRRSGWAGCLFTMYKFRTMHHGGAGTGQTQRNDPRCTRVGVLLRRTSVDELPQLWNVLIGDMSLVGPRPHADVLHAPERAGCELVAEYAQRQRVKPGMTGWAQVNGLRGAIFTPEQLRKRIEYDLFYIDHWSLFFDLRILAMTPLCVLRAENAF
jgi:Undecaprenyl-phosphate glucose phosphotransferase